MILEKIHKKRDESTRGNQNQVDASRDSSFHTVPAAEYMHPDSGLLIILYHAEHL